jgi:GNAT superfamily N-acetyltransferase
VKTQLGRLEAAQLCCVDYSQRMAFGVFDRKVAEGGRFLGVGRYDLNPRTNLATIALVVHQDHRGLGIGSHLLEQLMAYAQAKGVSGIQAEILPTNSAMLAIHRRMGHAIEWDQDAKLYKVKHRFGDVAGPDDDAPAAGGEPVKAG